MSHLPARMQKHEEEFGAKVPATIADIIKQRKVPEGDTISEEHTFHPKPPRQVPDFQRLHSSLKLELAERKLRMIQTTKKANLQPFYLRSEWTHLKALQEHESRYESCRVSDRVPEFKLKKLGLTRAATMWQLITVIANRSAGLKGGDATSNADEDKLGLMEAEMREFCIISPSHFAIGEAIDEDIMYLREERWPYSRGGRLPVQKAPDPKSKFSSKMKPATTKSQMHRMQHTAKWKEEFETRRVAEHEKLTESKKQREEFWGIKDKVQRALAGGIEKQRKAQDDRTKSMMQARKDFRNSTVTYKEGLDARFSAIKESQSLLMQRSIAKRLKAQATDLFRTHLKAVGLGDMADDLEIKH